MLNWGAFAKEKNGEWAGLNNAAIYSFNSNIINSFVREMFQNSIDARDKDLPLDSKTGKLPPLHIKINYKEILQKEFPDFDGFYGIFKKIATSGPNKSHIKFFNNAFAALKDKKKIPLFIYEDFNTIGLKGADDNTEERFNACVVSEGISVKSETTSGGSFGIGKNAIYGLSKLRTVFYCTVNTENRDFIFQGKAKLASYYDESGRTWDNKIYCGIGENYRSVRSSEELKRPYNKIFHRNEPGLSQFAVCPVENKNWPKEFAKAILRNYWMLLEKGGLIVELLEQDEIKYKLSGENLEDLMMHFYNPDTYEPEDIAPKGNPWEFYNCYKNGSCLSPDSVSKIGKVRFYYTEVENRSTNAIAYLRNDMVVYSDSVWGFGNIGYCGLFMCDDDKGNTILKAMEPPTHDSFSPDRLNEKLEGYSNQDGRKILNDIKILVKSGLQKILDKYTKPAEDILWLDNLLSSLTGAAGIGAGDRTNNESQNETTEKIGKEVKKKLMFKSQNRNIIIDEKNGEIEGLGGANPKIGPSPIPPEPRPGPKPSPRPIRQTKIKSRVFRTNKTTKIGNKNFIVYQLHLNSEKLIKSADFLISQQGDTGNVAMFEIGRAQIVNGEQLQFTEEKNKMSETFAYRIKSLTIPSVVELFVNEPYKSSFRIIKS